MTETLHVLVVDDEPGMRSGVARALRDYQVTFDQLNGQVAFAVADADTGEKCLERCRSSARPDILLLDYKLPGLSGLEILEEMAGYRPEMLTIMITAYASLETAINATRKGAYDFLAKPFTPDELRHTVRKAAERILLERRAKKLADEKRQLRFEFISIVAHELKAPLAAVEGYLRIIQEHAAGDDPKTYEQMIDRSLLRLQGMRKIILDLLDLTRIESGKVKREPAELDLTAVAKTAVETVLPDASERKITVNLRAPERVTFTADRQEMDIVFNNLLTNAIKYNVDNGKVDVTIEDADDRVVIRVADTGIGMTAEEREKLFQEFVRIRNEKTRSILGSGLGLSILKKIVDLYRGTIEVQSAPNAGTTFTITLPRQENSQPAFPR